MASCSSSMDFRTSLPNSYRSPNHQIPLSFILECFDNQLKKFINIKDLGDGLISRNLISVENFNKVLKTSKTETETDTASFLFNILKKICDEEEKVSGEEDLEYGRQFIEALTQSGVKSHLILAHYIQEEITEIPAESEEEQKFRKVLKEHLSDLTKALESPDLVTAFFQQTGAEEGQRLLNQRECRYIHVLLMLERNPGPIKGILLDALKNSKGFASKAKYLEEKSRLSEYDKMEIDDEDVRSFCGGHDSMDQDIAGDVAGNPSEGLNSMDDRFHSEEVKSSYMDYKPNIDDGEPSTKNPISMNKLEMDGTELKEMNEAPVVQSLKGGINLRPYQRELMSNATKGYNTVILAPTNSGKTIVAGKIIQLHFSNCIRRKPKVAFIVEKKILADQQEESIRRFLDQGSSGHSNLEIGKITGDTVVPDLDMMIDQLDIIVMTAGVLCRDHRADADRKISVSTFSLICFDECHHCERSHPYNRLMRMYRQEKEELSDVGHSGDLPQVVGLTATLGAGKGGTTVEKAVQHGLTILANLNAHKIETVIKEKESLLKNVSIPTEMSPVYVERREQDPVADIIMELMEESEEMLKKLPDYNLIPGVPNLRLRDMKDYERWVITAKEKHCPEKVINGENRRRLVVCLEHLAVYHKALCVNRDARCKDACTFMRERLDDLWKDRENLVDIQWQSQRRFYDQIKKMETLAKKWEYSNPLLVELERLIMMEFKANPKSRALLFTDKIETTLYLNNWILESPKMQSVIKPCRMTSETSEPQRKSLSEDFKAGKCNFMIVTSVVEEGIDIGACNLVYRLNYVPSGCGRIQQKGRIRAQNGRSYFVCYGNLKQNEMLTKMMEELMAKAVYQINQFTDEELQRLLSKFQRKDAQMLDEEIRKQRFQLECRDFKEYSLCCKRCNMDACKSSDFKCYNKSQHYVCSQEFCDEKIDIRPHPKPKKIDDMYRIGKVSCRKCGLDWGMLAMLEGSRFPVLRIDTFVIHELRDDGSPGGRMVVKKWKEVPFRCQDVNEVEEYLTYDADFESWE